MSFAMNYHRWIRDEIRPFLGACVAEVGAGMGSFSQLLLETQLEFLTAFEPSRNMFPALRESLHGIDRATAVNGFLDAQHVSQAFDTVAYINVLEHIEDDAGELEKAFSLLKPCGHLIVFVPALPWLYSKVDEQVGHYRRYSKNQLLDLVTSTGFSIVQSRYFDVAGIVPWYISFVLLKHGLSGNKVNLYDKLVVPPMRVLESMLTPPIGKNILLIARKP